MCFHNIVGDDAVYIRNGFVGVDNEFQGYFVSEENFDFCGFGQQMFPLFEFFQFELFPGLESLRLFAGGSDRFQIR